MHCVITAGPTYEPLDQVRRITNFSTGRLGSELAAYLQRRGHRVTLLLGEMATYRGALLADRLERFSTTDDLGAHLEALREAPVDALFHAAAVSDFSVRQIWERLDSGELRPVRSGKLDTRGGPWLAELQPTRKLIADLRGWFPDAVLVGWKFEVEGTRPDAIRRATAQLTECRTDSCVANGPAYGVGFGVVTPGADCRHAEDAPDLFPVLESLLGPAR